MQCDECELAKSLRHFMRNAEVTDEESYFAV